MEGPKRIICADCGVGPGRPFERAGVMWVCCPVCGQESRIADVQCEAIKQHINISNRSNGSVIAATGEPRRDCRWTLYG